MKKLLIFAMLIMTSMIFAQSYTDTIVVNNINAINLDEVTITSFYSNSVEQASKVDTKALIETNYGQEPSHVFKHMPSIWSMSDNGTEFGYGYYRIRGLDQTRINVTLDGMPWNEGEDFGTYFANSPDLMSSMHTIKVERGASSKTNGVAASAGNILLESVDLKNDTISHVDFVYGSYNTHKASVVYNMGLKNGWGLHIKATQSGTDGYRNSWNNSHALTAKLGYYFNDNHSIDILSMNGYHTNLQGWIGCYKDELIANPRANGDTEKETDNWWQSVNKLQYKGRISDNMVLTASAYLQFQTGSYRFDLDNYMYRFEDPTWEQGTTGIVYDYGLRHYLYGGNVFAKWYNLADIMDITTGVNVYRFQREHFMDDRNASHFENVGVEEYYDNIGYKTDANIFFEMAIHPSKNFTIGYNLQYRFVDFSYTDIMTNTSYTSKDLNTLWNFINGGINLNYDISKEYAVYTRLAVANREPTRSTMFGGTEYLMVDSIGNGLIATRTPEIVHDVEAGFVVSTKYVHANFNIFFMKFKDELVLTGTYGLNGLPEHVNADNSIRTGLEMSVDIEPIKNLHIVNNTAWSKNIVKTETFGNKTHVLSPEWTIDQDINYTINRVTFGANYNFHSSMFIDMENTFAIPSSMTLNAYVTAHFFRDKFELGLKLNNITNRENYYNAAYGATGEILYFQDAKFNFLTSAKFYF